MKLVLIIGIFWFIIFLALRITLYANKIKYGIVATWLSYMGSTVAFLLTYALFEKILGLSRKINANYIELHFLYNTLFYSILFIAGMISLLITAYSKENREFRKQLK